MGNSNSSKQGANPKPGNASSNFRVPSVYLPKENLIRNSIFLSQTQSRTQPFIRNLENRKTPQYHLDYAKTVSTYPVRANPSSSFQSRLALPSETVPNYKDKFGPISYRSSMPVGIVGNQPLIIDKPCLSSSKEFIDETVDRGQKSWASWIKDYTAQMASGPKRGLIDRISVNANKYSQQIHEIRMKRLIQTNEQFTQKETVKDPPSINSYVPLKPRLDSYRKNDEKYFSVEPKKPELTHEMLLQIQEASRPQPSNEVLVELDGVQILRKDIQTLLSLNWLNDEVINAYMNLLVLRGNRMGHQKVYAFNTFFYPKLRESGYCSVRRWTRKVDVFSFSFIIVPVHLGNHWCLAFIDFTKREISYYDSLGGYSNGCCDTLLDYLRDESNDKKKEDFDDENWRLVDKYNEGIPQQQNCSDCGVFACTYAEYLTRQAKLTFGQEHMPYFRKKMIYEITTKSILE